MAKKFFFVCAGLLCLAIAYHLGARSATAQSGSQVTGMAYGGLNVVVMTPNGECFSRNLAGGNGPFVGPVYAFGNFWDTPTAAQRESFGALKSRYRGERGAARPTTQDR